MNVTQTSTHSSHDYYYYYYVVEVMKTNVLSVRIRHQPVCFDLEVEETRLITIMDTHLLIKILQQLLPLSRHYIFHQTHRLFRYGPSTSAPMQNQFRKMQNRPPGQVDGCIIIFLSLRI